MKHLSLDQVHVVAVSPPRMSRREKMLRWADLVRHHRGDTLVLFHQLEYMDQYQLARVNIHGVRYDSAFTLATKDPVFNEQGLSSSANIVEIMSFFELSKVDMHEFGCDCGGAISPDNMANRIEHSAR